MTYFDDIYELAVDNYGIITSAEARELEISDKEMNSLTKRGRLTRRGHGVDKLARYVPTPNDAYAEAVALVGPKANLFGESVLDMLGLAPTNPARVFVATPVRMRKKLPEHIVVVKANDNVNHYEGIRSQNLVDAVLACKRTMMPERLVEATNEASKQGFISKTQKDELLEMLER